MIPATIPLNRDLGHGFRKPGLCAPLPFQAN